MIDILAIRNKLNELPFSDGKRQVSFARISDHVDLNEPEFETEEDDEAAAWQDSPKVLEYLQQVQAELHKHHLLLARDEENPDVLCAVQTLRRSSGFDFSRMADAMNWVSRIIAIAIMMVGLGSLGLWLDHQLETSFIGIVGFVIGVPLGLWYLILITRQPAKNGDN